MKFYSLMTISLLFLLLTSCAVGPLVSHESARTVGAGKHELIVGSGQTGWMGKWNYGLGKNFDFGVQAESLSFGAKAKYAFLNQSEGWSMALGMGYGTGIMSDHFYGDLYTSFKSGPIEPYMTIRYVQVHTDKEDIDVHEAGNLQFNIESLKFQYGQVMIGTRLWLTRHWVFSVEGSTFFGAGEDLKISETYFFNAGLGYRF